MAASGPDSASVVVTLEPGVPASEIAETTDRMPRPWYPRIKHPLQPAIHFQGRTALLEQLSQWWSESDHGTRVVSLVAAGGTGKTALIERFLRDVQNAPLPGGVFVWSFYEDNRTETFLRAACEYFAEFVHIDPLGCLHHLLEVLGNGTQHLVVLDGIELVQEPLKSARPLGSLRDPLLKRLLVSIADGLGRARAMITSRFPLPDLQPWEDEARCHWPISLESLDEDAAVAVFEAWGVRGERSDLIALGRQVGFHALSIAVLAGYLARACGGDPAGASQFDLEAAERDGPHAQKLARILAAYADALHDDERHVLSLLSTLPRGADVETLASLMSHAPLEDIAGTLESAQEPLANERATPVTTQQWTETQIVRDSLDRLLRAGLVYRSNASTPGSRQVYSAHPFVKDYFKGLVGVVAVNSTMANLITPSLTDRPGRPITRDELDRFEQLVEHLVLSDERGSALSIYQRLGGYEHLATLGEYVRGRRMLELILGSDAPESSLDDGLHDVEDWLELIPRTDASDGYFLLRELGHYAQAMGELDEAERRYSQARAIFLFDKQTIEDLCGEADDFTTLYLKRGLLSEALAPLPLVPASENLSSLITFLRAGGDPAGIACAAARYSPNVLCAPWSEAVHHAMLSARPVSKPLAQPSIPRLTRAATASGPAPPWDEHGEHALSLARAHLALPVDVPTARAVLDQLHDWISDAGSGDIQLVLTVHHLAARIALATGDLETSLRQSRLAAQTAETCGFGLLAIDLRLMEARARLAAGDAVGALALTDAALANASDRTCDDRWAVADAWHLRALSQRPTDRESARASAKEALRLREQLQHPGVQETRSLVRTLDADSS